MDFYISEGVAAGHVDVFGEVVDARGVEATVEESTKRTRSSMEVGRTGLLDDFVR